MNRRSFLSRILPFAAGVATVAAIDPEQLLWQPGTKAFSIPETVKPVNFRTDLYTVDGTYAPMTVGVGVGQEIDLVSFIQGHGEMSSYITLADARISGLKSAIAQNMAAGNMLDYPGRMDIQTATQVAGAQLTFLQADYNRIMSAAVQNLADEIDRRAMVFVMENYNL